MDKKYFKLRVKTGTKIISTKGDYIVSDIPDNALEFLEKGASWLVLAKEADVPLSKLEEPRLRKLKSLRATQGFSEDVIIISRALELKQKGDKPKVEAKPEK
ncbi:hypothetical protein [Riemerella columbipharyngis]|uniref:Uncharacterized protein n=1 Tax=Riemerella columbipharyngis TaxID=1071918 RepID=A0A1G7EXG9_9FLAO|nr:hypothetical protein [Riemerella columbipharyngis]SDE68393.1 hypothetical protein SAMN05421544_11813 [Riemerella columbipharyngis]